MAAGMNDVFETPKSGGFTIKEHIYKYLSYWPLFLFFLIVCVGTGLLYTRYATPIYRASTLILVKGDQANGGGGRTSEDLIKMALEGGQKSNNLDNEIQLLTSTGLMERVTAKNQFNIRYYKLANIRKIDLYLDIPFQLKPLSVLDSATSLAITVSDVSNDGGMLKYGPGNTNSMKFKWDKPLWIADKKFILIHDAPIQNVDGNYLIAWNPVKQEAAEIASRFSVDVLDKKSSIIRLEVLAENLKRGQDILDAVYKEFNLSDIEEKNAVSENTIRFIDERLAVISGELSGVEGNLESYQGNNQIINVASQSSQSFDNANDVSKSITSVNVQQGVIQMIKDYFNGSDNLGKLVPSSLGINDVTLSTLIARYNELALKKEREAPALAPNGAIMKDFTNQLTSLKESILENLQNITKNLQLQENSLHQKDNQYRQFLSALPHKERVMQEIKRKQSITEGLYLYLLQKREETSISASSSNVSIYKQIDKAKGEGPVEPNTKNIRLYSIAFGLLIPVGLIRLRDVMNEKITKRSDITGKTQVPLIGELSHIPKSKNTGIVVLSRDLIAEQFRLLRTNLTFLKKTPGCQVILVTSSTTSEGKSFLSLNLAAVLAAPGDKVALLEFDMRLPGIYKMVDLKVSKGLSDYLSGDVNSINEIKHTDERLSGLHIYPSGSVPVNPADLLLSEKLNSFIEQLKQQYKYIIIDSAPIGLVTDALILGKYADCVMYMVRQNHTGRKQIDFINEIYASDKFVNMRIVFNDVRSGGKYGAGYGQKLAYEYSYGNFKKPNVFNRIMHASRKTIKEPAEVDN
ncbi:MAG: polysaccharide biosynthesis tyrosine autokinase [Bacteroidota bacterium]